MSLRGQRRFGVFERICSRPWAAAGAAPFGVGGAVNTGVWRCPARSSSYLEPGFGGDADQASAARPTQCPSRRGLRARPLCRTAAPRLGRTQRAPRGPGGGGQWRVAVREALFRNLTPERTFPASVRPRIPAAPDPPHPRPGWDLRGPECCFSYDAGTRLGRDRIFVFSREKDCV